MLFIFSAIPAALSALLMLGMATTRSIQLAQPASIYHQE
jgi:hypothetical protein